MSGATLNSMDFCRFDRQCQWTAVAFTPMQRLITFSVFILLVVAAAAIAGQFVGGEWYQSMNRPAWNPSALIMAIVWPAVYMLMAVSAWMVWDTMRGLAWVALTWWGVQLILCVTWSWTFFGMHRVGWSLGVMGLWVVAVLLTTISFRSIRIEASSLMIPVAIWSLFTLILNFSWWVMNGGGVGSIF